MTVVADKAGPRRYLVRHRIGRHRVGEDRTQGWLAADDESETAWGHDGGNRDVGLAGSAAAAAAAALLWLSESGAGAGLATAVGLSAIGVSCTSSSSCARGSWLPVRRACVFARPAGAFLVGVLGAFFRVGLSCGRPEDRDRGAGFGVVCLLGLGFGVTGAAAGFLGRGCFGVCFRVFCSLCELSVRLATCLPALGVAGVPAFAGVLLLFVPFAPLPCVFRKPDPVGVDSPVAGADSSSLDSPSLLSLPTKSPSPSPCSLSAPASLWPSSNSNLGPV